MDPTIQAAWVAVVGTLLGGLVGGGLQAWASHRTIRVTRDEAAAHRDEVRQALELQLREERFRRLWSERRTVFGRLLQVADQWRLANSDLRGLGGLADSELGATPMPRQTLEEARKLSPEVATALERMDEFGQVTHEIHLLSDAEVRGAVENLRATLRAAMQESAKGAKPDSDAHAQAVALVSLAMRRELIHGTTVDRVGDSG